MGEYEDNVGLSVDDIHKKCWDNIDGAYEFYRKYGRFHGFGIRKADSGKDCDRNVVRYRFFYNREERHGRHYDRIDQMRVHKLETKANCRGKLSIYFEKIEQIWKVRKVILEHNHELTPVSMAHMIANHREISEAAKATTDGIHAHGIAT
ncbi:Protein FAR1-RELATED SEQUENCE [Arachis hypogaea]|nr:Protein FAR1-RELATED SEQUENCE [Arachis hypogaea]